MADKLIYIMNLSFLIASIFCIISFNIKYIYKDLFYIICIFMINVVNIHNSTVFYFISIALSFLLFIKTLSEYSNIPESYWLYGIEADFLNERKDFTCIRETVEQLIENDLIDKNVEFNDDIKDVLLTALKADIKHLFLKRK